MICALAYLKIVGPKNDCRSLATSLLICAKYIVGRSARRRSGEKAHGPDSAKKRRLPSQLYRAPWMQKIAAHQYGAIASARPRHH